MWINLKVSHARTFTHFTFSILSVFPIYCRIDLIFCQPLRHATACLYSSSRLLPFSFSRLLFSHFPVFPTFKLPSNARQTLCQTFYQTLLCCKPSNSLSNNLIPSVSLSVHRWQSGYRDRCSIQTSRRRKRKSWASQSARHS